MNVLSRRPSEGWASVSGHARFEDRIVDEGEDRARARFTIGELERCVAQGVVACRDPRAADRKDDALGTGDRRLGSRGHAEDRAGRLAREVGAQRELDGRARWTGRRDGGGCAWERGAGDEVRAVRYVSAQPSLVGGARSSDQARRRPRRSWPRRSRRDRRWSRCADRRARIRCCRRGLPHFGPARPCRSRSRDSWRDCRRGKASGARHRKPKRKSDEQRSARLDRPDRRLGALRRRGPIRSHSVDRPPGEDSGTIRG
jgi:hypothetical protein